MKVFIDDNAINIVQSVASASTMISSLATEAKMYILSKFPKGYFKHVYIDTSETVIQQNRNDLYNPHANKIPYPSMTISPEISLDDPIAGMEKGLHLSSPDLYLRKDMKRTYNKILIDPDEKISIFYTSDYITTNFNFKVVTNSFIQNADISFFLKSKFQREFFQFYNNRPLRSEIPKTFIKAIADLKNWNLNNPEEMDELRLYLIGSSKTPDAIQKRVNLATGKQCFFINEMQNLLLLFTDLDCPSSINRESQAEGDYTISFRLQVSAWIPNNYILSISKASLKRLTESTVNDLDNPPEDDRDNYLLSANIITTNSLTKKRTINFYDENKEEQVGHLIYSDIYTYDAGRTLDNLDILKLLGDDIKKLYSYGLTKMHLNMSSFMKVKIITNSKILEENIDYRVSYNDINEPLKLTFLSEIDSDFAFSVYLNRLLVETIKKAMEEDKNYILARYIGSVLINIGNKKEKVLVKGFINDREKSSTDIMKSLRVNTAFGIGYISLVDDNEKDSYKICLGYDKNNNPIIKQFEMEVEYE